MAELFTGLGYIAFLAFVYWVGFVDGRNQAMADVDRLVKLATRPLPPDQGTT